MSDEPDNVTLRYLRRLDEKVDRLTDAVLEISTEMRGLKTHMAGFMQNEIAQDSAMASVKARLDRIERRLDISGVSEQ